MAVYKAKAKFEAPKLSKYKIFYDDGTTITDEICPINKIPKRGVQGIVVADPSLGRRTEHSSDFYIFVPTRGTWRGVDYFGMYDYMIEPGFKLVLYGRVLSDEDYRKFWDLMLSDTYLPPKSATGAKERKVT